MEHTFKAVEACITAGTYPEPFRVTDPMRDDPDKLKKALIRHFGNSLYDAGFVQKQNGRT